MPRLGRRAARRRAAVGRVRGGLPRGPGADRRRRAGIRRLRGAGAPRPGGFTLPHGPRDALTFPTPTGQARFTVNPLSVDRGPGRAGCCCRPYAATTSTTPRSTGWTTATAVSTVDGEWSSSTRTTWPHSASPTARSSTSCRSGRDGVRAARPGVPGGGLPDRARAVPPRTSPRPTCSCRSTRPPRARRPRRRSRSSSDSNRSPHARIGPHRHRPEPRAARRVPVPRGGCGR